MSDSDDLLVVVSENESIVVVTDVEVGPRGFPGEDGVGTGNGNGNIDGGNATSNYTSIDGINGGSA